MKKYLIIFLVFFIQVNFLQAENNTVTEIFSNSQSQAAPWTREIALQYNMAILAKIYKNGVLFQPTGVLLGIFKDNKCWGFAGIGTSPFGPIMNVTMGYNTATASGFTYKVYDPSDERIYEVVETVNFKSNTPVGLINAPISLNVINPIAQVIDFTISNKTIGDAAFTVTATGGNSGNPIVFKSSNESVATCSGTNGSTITIIGVGSCTISANQKGNNSYYDAIQVDKTLTVSGTPTLLGQINFEQLSVFPNPIESQFQIRLNSTSVEKAKVEIYNTQGLLVKTIFEGSINGERILTIQRENELPNGIYLIKANVGTKELTKKIVVK